MIPTYQYACATYPSHSGQAIQGVARRSPPLRPNSLWHDPESQPLDPDDLGDDQFNITVEQSSEPMDMSNSFDPYEGQPPQMIKPVRRAESGVEWGGIMIAEPSTPGSSSRSNLSRSDTRTTAASRRKNGSEVIQK